MSMDICFRLKLESSRQLLIRGFPIFQSNEAKLSAPEIRDLQFYEKETWLANGHVPSLKIADVRWSSDEFMLRL
jgi:hypothetical protein